MEQRLYLRYRTATLTCGIIEHRLYLPSLTRTLPALLNSDFICLIEQGLYLRSLVATLPALLNKDFILRSLTATLTYLSWLVTLPTYLTTNFIFASRVSICIFDFNRILITNFLQFMLDNQCSLRRMKDLPLLLVICFTINIVLNVINCKK